MKLFFSGDIFGPAGRKAFRTLLPGVIREFGVDVVVANCENAATGHGITPDIYRELVQAGADCLTSGNHIFDRHEIIDPMDRGDCPLLLRPVNYPSRTPGRGMTVIDAPGGVKIGVVCVMGAVFMNPVPADPWEAVDRALEGLRNETPCILVDMHAETTSEKQAMGVFCDGRASAVIGTHTHVQTADERILPGGCAYITDAGMTGPYDSVIGMNAEISVRRFVRKIPEKGEMAGGGARLCGVVLDIDTATGQSRSIVRVNRPLDGGREEKKTA
ncbi:MAG: TIGR00282 family metallophosphoesterase [Deltaproteobacteria bacterium]|nr:TIGR00282 family metallophosphoesterase [Deltaproteobacteria bacterium]